MNNENAPNADAKPSSGANDKAPKRAYTAPKLKQYGDIRELTLGNVNNVNTDAAGVSIVTTG
jgi:hypothetical protein